MPDTRWIIFTFIRRKIVLLVGNDCGWAVAVAQLAEWLPPIPEVRGSNPVIGKILHVYC